MPASKRQLTALSTCLCRLSTVRCRGGFAIVGVFFLAILGIALLGAMWCMPVALRAVDAEVLAEAGRGTARLRAAEDSWIEVGKPGTARVFEQANAHLRMSGDEIPVLPVTAPAEDPVLHLWGGADPFLQQIFADGLPRSEEAHPPVLPLFISRESRGALGAYLDNSPVPSVVAVLANREVESAAKFMPVDTAAGQPLEATIYLTALLLQGNHFAQDVETEIQRLAEEATTRNELGEMEAVYLDLLALGSRLQWQALADLMSLLPDLSALRRTAQVTRALEEDWSVFVAAALWSRDPAGLSEYLVARGEAALEDLKKAMSHGKGALDLLLAREDPVHEPTWRAWVPEAPVLLSRLFAQAPVLGAGVKLGALFLGLFFLFLATNLFSHARARRETLGPGTGFSFLQATLLAVAFGVTFLFFNEPLFLEEGQKSEFNLQLPMSTASTGAPSSIEHALSLTMDQVTLISLGLFFVLQLITYIICRAKVAEIRRQPISTDLKLQLLENEEQLFDTGLYIGLAGTIGGLILLAIDIIGPSLMAAYASTLFGIVFVALFKILHLRPYRRRLIIESQTSSV